MFYFSVIRGEDAKFSSKDVKVEPTEQEIIAAKKEEEAIEYTEEPNKAEEPLKVKEEEEEKKDTVQYAPQYPPMDYDEGGIDMA